MDIAEMKVHCHKQIELLGDDANVTFKLPGNPNKRGQKRLWFGGPVGTVVSDYSDRISRGVVVMFKAQEVLDALEKI